LKMAIHPASFRFSFISSPSSRIVDTSIARTVRTNSRDAQILVKQRSVLSDSLILAFIFF
jgi:hypothetical protein